MAFKGNCGNQGKIWKTSKIFRKYMHICLAQKHCKKNLNDSKGPSNVNFDRNLQFRFSLGHYLKTVVCFSHNLVIYFNLVLVSGSQYAHAFSQCLRLPFMMLLYFQDLIICNKQTGTDKNSLNVASGEIKMRMKIEVKIIVYFFLN